MRGFQKGKKPTAQYADGGVVKGPGTGTSDDVETNVPNGSYIMPADSTNQIGAEQLGQMGQQVPVNLSNGEYQLPPEQVHAIGVQALNQMKNSTHMPVEEGSEGEAPELYFANGGVVDDPTKRRQASTGTEIGGFGFPGARDAFKTAVAEKNQSFANGEYAKGLGQSVRGGIATVGSAIGDFGYGIGRPLANFGSGLLGTSDSPPAQANPVVQPTAQPAASQPAAQQAPAAQPTPAPAAVLATTAAAAPTADQQAGAPAAPIANNVTRVGNSFSGSNIGAGFTVNGQPFAGSGTPTNPDANSKQNQQAVSNLMARTPEFGQGPAAQQAMQQIQSGAVGFLPAARVMGDSGAAEQERRNLINAASTAYRGSQNGQLTANQLRVLADIQTADDRNNLARDTTDANNAAQMAQAQLREGAATQRTAMQEEGATGRSTANNQVDMYRINTGNDLETKKFNSEQQVRGFQVRAAQRLEGLQKQYDAATTDEQRKSIADKINAINGKDQNRFTVVPGGQEIDPTTQQLVTRPAQVLNNQTGQFMQQPVQQRPTGLPEPKSAAEYAALPKGAKYMRDGVVMTKTE